MFADFDTICGVANGSVREEEVSSPFQSIIMPPTHTVDVLVSVHCVVVKVNTVLVMKRGTSKTLTTTRN